MISVCMATYNGERFIKQQLDSILNQLSIDDELIISDDSSTDKTLEIIEQYKDSRITLFKMQKFKSPIFNFENAIRNAGGDIIVLADQDDIWEINKIKVIKESFVNEIMSFKMYNGCCVDSQNSVIGSDLFICLKVKKGFFRNMVSNSFIGCNIAFNKELLDYILPFPKDIPMHDMWIGSCAYLFGEVEFVDTKVFRYRLHENNYTGKKSSLTQKVIWRYKLLKNLIRRYVLVK